MSEVTRAEFDGLGNRVNTFREEFVGCRATNTKALDMLADISNTQEESISKLFQGQEDIKVGFAGMKGRLTIAGAIAALIIPILTALIIRFTIPRSIYGGDAHIDTGRSSHEVPR